MDEALHAEMDAVASAVPTTAPLHARRHLSPARLFYVAALLGALGWGLYAQHQLHLSQAETAMLQDALDQERSMTAQPVHLPTLPAAGYQFANHTPSRGTF